MVVVGIIIPIFIVIINISLIIFMLNEKKKFDKINIYHFYDKSCRDNGPFAYIYTYIHMRGRCSAKVPLSWE